MNFESDYRMTTGEHLIAGSFTIEQSGFGVGNGAARLPEYMAPQAIYVAR